MPSKPKFLTVPQRSDGKGYVDCEVHRATNWAVKKQTRRNGVTVTTVLSRHPTKTIADGEVLSRSLGATGPKRQYALGKRMEPFHA